MYWLTAGLFVVGAVCGATVRLMAFVVVLLGATAVAVAVCAAQGWGIALLAVIAVVVLQIGYAGGFVLRAALRVRLANRPSRGKHEPPIPAPLGEKRR